MPLKFNLVGLFFATLANDCFYNAVSNNSTIMVFTLLKWERRTCQHSNFEETVGVPWMIYDPLHTSASLSGFKLKPPSKRADPSTSLRLPFKTIHDPGELVDMFTTILELADVGRIEKEKLSLWSDGVSQARVIINGNLKADSFLFSFRTTGTRSVSKEMLECPSVKVWIHFCHGIFRAHQRISIYGMERMG